MPSGRSSNNLPEINDAIREVLRRAGDFAFPPPEQTFFSIENIIGRLEDPTTKLLLFFLNPKACHGLGDLFLQSFFESLGEDSGRLDLVNATVREWPRTDDGKIPDIVVEGHDWVLVVENKIGAPPNNPWSSYKSWANSRKPKRFFAVLSPDGRLGPDAGDAWKAVTYADYCETLDSALQQCGSKSIKWRTFAAELVLHLSNYFSTRIMNETQTQFVEQHLRQIGDIKELSASYDTMLLEKLSVELKAAVSAERNFIFSANEDRFVCVESVRDIKIELWFQTPAHKRSNADRRFVASLWLSKLPLGHEDRGFEVEEGGSWVVKQEDQFSANLTDAIDKLCRLAGEWFSLVECAPQVSEAPNPVVSSL